VDAIPGNFINIKLVRQPQVVSNFREKIYIGKLAQPQQCPTFVALSMFVARFNEVPRLQPPSIHRFSILIHLQL
jgi:hypothetical protein